jgi:LPXTG-motif cell wall-anchored protein
VHIKGELVGKRLKRSFWFVITTMMVAFVVPMGAIASPTAGAAAAAWGLELKGLVVVAPTNRVDRVYPPAGVSDTSLITIPLSGLVFSGTGQNVAKTADDSTLTPLIPVASLKVLGGGTLPAGFNAQGSSRVEGLGALSAPLGIQLPVDLTGGLVKTGLIQSEADVTCQSGNPVFSAGTKIAQISVAGADLTGTVDGTLNQVLALPASLSILAPLLTIVVNETIPTTNGVQVNAVHVTVLPNGAGGGAQELIVAHSEVSGSTCKPVGPECSDGIDNDGDGKIDAADPGCHTDGNANNPRSYDANDTSEADMPRTGGPSSQQGILILGLGALLGLAAFGTRKWRTAKDEV